MYTVTVACQWKWSKVSSIERWGGTRKGRFRLNSSCGIVSSFVLSTWQNLESSGKFFLIALIDVGFTISSSSSLIDVERLDYGCVPFPRQELLACMDEEGSWAAACIPPSLLPDVVWPAASGSCHLEFPAVIDWTFVNSFVWVFYPATRKETKAARREFSLTVKGTGPKKAETWARTYDKSLAHWRIGYFPIAVI